MSDMGMALTARRPAKPAPGDSLPEKIDGVQMRVWKRTQTV